MSAAAPAWVTAWAAPWAMLVGVASAAVVVLVRKLAGIGIAAGRIASHPAPLEPVTKKGSRS